MAGCGTVGGLADRPRGPGLPRTSQQIEAEITTGMAWFQRERMGRGPADIRTLIVEDTVVIRLQGSLTPAERALIQAGGMALLKQVQMKLLESEKETLQRLLRGATGRGVASTYSDLCPRTGEWLIAFRLCQDPDPPGPLDG